MRRGSWVSKDVWKVSAVRPQLHLKPAAGSAQWGFAAGSGRRGFRAPHFCLGQRQPEMGLPSQHPASSSG